MADEPTKPPNRDKPFKRINNQQFIPKTRPDGLGRECGCQSKNKDFNKDEIKKFEDFIERNLPVIGPLMKVIRIARVAADLIATAIRIAQAASLFFPFVGVAVVSTLEAIRTVVTAILDAVDTALTEFFKFLFRRLLPRAVRVIPHWSPVRKGASNSVVTADQIVEVEGLVTRSYMNPIDVPFEQWHFWYNWSVHVAPEPDYQQVLANVPNPINSHGIAGERPIAKPRTFEIQWDAGAMFEDQTPFLNGFPESQIPQHDAPILRENPAVKPGIETGWIWPMTGMFAWASGRFVYDCSRNTVDKDTKDPKEEEPTAEPNMAAMINPPRALATARWGAVIFEQNEHAVPAIQFLFFACRRGGYISHQTLADGDYEFIVDLPPLQVEAAPFPIGHTPEFPHSTIVVRPRLLQKLEGLPFAGATQVQPEIQAVRPDDPKKPPSQVIVKIPAGALEGQAAAGFLLSLGWHDPNNERAAKVKKCKVTLDKLSGKINARESAVRRVRQLFKDQEKELVAKIAAEVGGLVAKIPGMDKVLEAMVKAAINAFLNALEEILPLGKEEWLFRFGVNGVWRTHFFGEVGTGIIDLDASLKRRFTFELFLAEDDLLFHSAHGTEMEPVGDLMREPFKDRVLTVPDRAGNPRPVLWSEIADPKLPEDVRNDLVFQYIFKLMSKTTPEGKLTLGFDNWPLGIIDPDPSTRGSRASSNPHVIKENVPGIRGVSIARFARAVEQQMIYVESSKDDYEIAYTVTVEDQIKK
jgi:hypothetical protein